MVTDGIRTLVRAPERAGDLDPGAQAKGVPRKALLLLGTPLLFVGLAHLNIHVVGGVPFAIERLLVPALFGLGIGLLLHRDVVRSRELRASLDSLEDARNEALAAARAREALLGHARRQVHQLRAEHAASLVALGAVHDLRNLLVPVALAAALLAEEPELVDEVAPQLTAAVVRGRALCNRILEAEAGPAGELLDVDTAVDDALRLTVMLLGVDVSIALSLPPARVLVDPQDLLQIVHNVVGNSANARPRGLRLRVTGGRAGGVYRVRIHDNGPGLPPDFDPDAGGSEPRDGENHGIGLRIVQAMATRNGGRFWLEHASRGAVAVVELPLGPG
jgi:signal transduction histidine kinase